jgi:cystathionine gamma-synthase
MSRYAYRATARLHPSTVAVAAGRPPGAGQPLNQPPVFASAFASGESLGYARRSNPTWEAFERTLGELEGGAAVAFASGMAAATAAIDSLSEGARVLVADSAYLEVRRLLAERSTRGRVRVREVDALDTKARGRSPSLTRPWRPCAAATPRARRRSRPAQRTKSIGGHSDRVLGAAVARDPGLAARLRGSRTASRLLESYGAVVSFDVGSAARADSICAAVGVITHASSLGGVETLIERQGRWHPEPAVPAGLLRLSVGCEHPEDLWRDLDGALCA